MPLNHVPVAGRQAKSERCDPNHLIALRREDQLKADVLMNYWKDRQKVSKGSAPVHICVKSKTHLFGKTYSTSVILTESQANRLTDSRDQRKHCDFVGE